MRLGPWIEAVQTCFASRQTQPMALPAGADAMLAHDGGDDLPDIERERIARMQVRRHAPLPSELLLHQAAASEGCRSRGWVAATDVKTLLLRSGIRAAATAAMP